MVVGGTGGCGHREGLVGVVKRELVGVVCPQMDEGAFLLTVVRQCT